MRTTATSKPAPINRGPVIVFAGILLIAVALAVALLLSTAIRTHDATRGSKAPAQATQAQLRNQRLLELNALPQAAPFSPTTQHLIEVNQLPAATLAITLLRARYLEANLNLPEMTRAAAPNTHLIEINMLPGDSQPASGSNTMKRS